MKTQTTRSNNIERTALILGATGGIGGAIAAALSQHGWSIRAMVRDPDKAEAHACGELSPPRAIRFVPGDAMCRDDVIRAATQDSVVDVIVHAVNPPRYRHWDKLVLPMLENTIAAARAAGGARIVLPGTVYNYDPATTPVITEHTSQNTTTRKGRIRVALEERLRTVAPEVPSLILRAGDFFGPGTRASWFAQAMIAAGKPVRKITSMAPGVPHAYAYLPDLAAAFAQVLDVADALHPHERLQFEGHWDSDGQSIRNAIRSVVGGDVPEKAFPWWLMRMLAPFGGFPREAIEIEPVWRYPMKLNNARLVNLIGTEPHTELEWALTQTLSALDCLESTEPLSQSGAR